MYLKMDRKHEVYFADIEGVITKLIRQSTAIMGCMSWFTNRRLLGELYYMEWLRVIVNDDSINQEHYNSYRHVVKHINQYNKPADVKQDALWLMCNNTDDTLMHNKFMIMMKNRKPFAVVTGSYNWTYRANDNLENIVVLYDEQSINKYRNHCRAIFKYYDDINCLKKIRG